MDVTMLPFSSVPATDDPVDISIDFLNYDWREASGAPARAAKRQATNRAAQVNYKPTATAEAPPRAAERQAPYSPNEPVVLNSVRLATASADPRSDTAPELVPLFIRNHLQPCSHNTYQHGSPGSSPPGASWCTTNNFAPSHFMPLANAADQPVVQSQLSYDPAVAMLNSLECRLRDIQSTLWNLPRTGYANQRVRAPQMQQAEVQQPMVQQRMQEMPVTSHDPLEDEMDQDFLALMDTMVPGAKKATSVPQNRRAEEVQMLGSELELKEKLEHKEKNRQSARASRERKKCRLVSLHAQVEELTTQNLELVQTATELAEDNAKLWAELETLTGCKKDKVDLQKILFRSAVAEVTQIESDDGVAADGCLGKSDP